MQLRQLICAVLGHVDSGKTTLLDAIRGTRVYALEPGAITQHIGASEIPLDVIKQVCEPIITTLPIKLELPGLLFIDTPGHEVFTNLRRRGGSVADIAILVVDVTKGLETQTIESLEILQSFKTPFVVALNKIDLITGWIAQKNLPFSTSFKKQRADVQQALEQRLYQVVGQLAQHGFSSERFDRVRDFTKEVVIIPTSARTGEGLAELLLYLTGLAQRYLKPRLALKEGARGVVLEVKRVKGIGDAIDAIIYDGALNVGDNIAFATSEGVAKTVIKALFRPSPLQEMRLTKKPFTSVHSAVAACGIRIACTGAGEALPGSPLIASSDIESAAQEIGREVSGIIFASARDGVILKTDALGSAEAISALLSREGIAIRKTGIGNLTKEDLSEAVSVASKAPELGVIFAFNVGVEPGLRAAAAKAGIEIIDEKVIYSLVERWRTWRAAFRARARAAALRELTLPARLRVLPGALFRVSKPAIFGVEVELGAIRKGCALMSARGEAIGRIASIQRERQSLESAGAGDRVAIAINEVVFGRHVREGQLLLTSPDREEVKVLEERAAQVLSDEERELLREIKRIKGYAIFS